MANINHPNFKLALLKSKETQSKLRKEKEVQYYLNPNNCKNCSSIINYEKRYNVFCNKSCSVTFNNKGVDRSWTDEQKIKNLPALIKKNKNRSIEKIKIFKQKPLNEKQCKECSNLFSYINRNKVYCSNECRIKGYSKRAKNNPLFGGNKNRHSLWYISPIAGKVYLESSYELKLAKELDANNIKWIRPKFLYYIIDNTRKRYFPDFYLIDFDIYLDPKNFYLIEKDKLKIQYVKEQNNIKLLVLNKDELTWDILYNILRLHR